MVSLNIFYTNSKNMPSALANKSKNKTLLINVPEMCTKKNDMMKSFKNRQRITCRCLLVTLFLFLLSLPLALFSCLLISTLNYIIDLCPPLLQRWEGTWPEAARAFYPMKKTKINYWARRRANACKFRNLTVNIISIWDVDKMFLKRGKCIHAALKQNMFFFPLHLL